MALQLRFRSTFPSLNKLDQGSIIYSMIAAQWHFANTPCLLPATLPASPIPTLPTCIITHIWPPLPQVTRYCTTARPPL